LKMVGGLVEWMAVMMVEMMDEKMVDMMVSKLVVEKDSKMALKMAGLWVVCSVEMMVEQKVALKVD